MLSDRVIASFARLGITVEQTEGQTHADILRSLGRIAQPYRATGPRFIQMVAAHDARKQFNIWEDDDLETMDEDDLSDVMPSIYSFRVNTTDPIDEFDTEQFFLLGDDCYHFFLLRFDDTAADPALYMLDHEEMDEAPWTTFTLGQFLDMLEPEAED